jgi:Lrp/AsnC family transcriptional regulator for asnA, asnC and gidA
MYTYFTKFTQLSVKLTLSDRKILILLNQDARRPSSQIAHSLGISERTVRNRIKRLVAEGVITPIGVVNPSVFGYSMVVDIFCQVEIAQRDQVLDTLAHIPEIAYIAFSSGDEDIILRALFKNSNDMNEFLTDRLYQISGLKRTHTVLVPSIIKEVYQWMPPAEDFEPG